MPKLAAPMGQAEAGVLADMAFPNKASITRLAGAILLEQNDERAVQPTRDMTLETIAPLSHHPIVSLPAKPARCPIRPPKPDNTAPPPVSHHVMGRDRLSPFTPI